MNLRINKMHLTNFKGIKDRTIDFNSNLTEIIGKNGSGKTTLATAYHWLFANTDNDLKSNPNVYPIGLEEGCPSVEIDMTIDNKPVKIRKTQTRKVTESNGTKKVALTNTYSVNEVPLSERDMQKKLSDMGFDFEKFSTLTNPNAFLSEEKDIQRKMLFAMASNYTDYQVATMLAGVDEATALLKDYSVDEVKAMENATLKKITENYGKKGEILNSKIEGLEMSKVDIDFAELELNRNLLKEKIEKNQDAQRIGNLILGELDGLRKKQMELQFELSDLLQKKENEKNLAIEKSLIERKSKEDELNSITKALRTAYDDLRTHDGIIEFMQKEVNKYAEKVEQIKARAFDDSSIVCPVCHRAYEPERVEELKKHFEDDKKSKLEEANSALDSAKKDLENRKPEKTLIEIRIKQLENSKATLEKALSEPINVSQSTNDSTSAYQPEIDRLNAEIESVNKLMENKKSSMPNMANLSSEELNLQGELRDCEIQLGKADHNNMIDGKIEMLRQQQIEFEQNRANAEKILYELDEIQKQKNQLITDEINKNFEIVKFLFFTYLKNGSYTEACIATVNGKELGASVNTGLEIRAKLDIIRGLQKFYDLNMPVFLDQAEALDDTSLAQIQMDNQMVYLTVTNDSEITIKEV